MKKQRIAVAVQRAQIVPTIHIKTENKKTEN